MALHITDANYAQTLAENPVVVIDFGATWCGPCKALAPIVEKVAEEYEGRAVVGKADIEEAEDTAMGLGIRSVPQVIFFKDGKQVNKIVGLTTAEKIKAAIDALL